MKRAFPAALALAAMALAAAAFANDGVAEKTAGGLVLKQTDDIDLVSEDLYVSTGQVRVRYVFRNRRPRDVRVTVAFPMPDRNYADIGDSAFPADFATRVDGHPVRMQVERRALLNGVDQSAQLRELGVPIISEDGVAAIVEALDRLRPEQQRRLLELGLVDATVYEAEGERRHYEPRWTVKETWFWEQVFPASRDLAVEHEYTPGVGTMAGSYLAYAMAQANPDLAGYVERFCVDRPFLTAVERMIAHGTPERPALLSELSVGYILTTGAGWRSPIRDFRLVVDKGRPENIVSFCGTGVRRISPTRFEMRRRNWRPDRDLAVLIITPDRKRTSESRPGSRPVRTPKSFRRGSVAAPCRAFLAA